MYAHVHTSIQKGRSTFTHWKALPMVGRGEFSQLPLHHLYVYSKAQLRPDKNGSFRTSGTLFFGLHKISSFMHPKDSEEAEVDSSWEVSPGANSGFDLNEKYGSDDNFKKKDAVLLWIVQSQSRSWIFGAGDNFGFSLQIFWSRSEKAPILTNIFNIFWNFLKMSVKAQSYENKKR